MTRVRGIGLGPHTQKPDPMPAEDANRKRQRNKQPSRRLGLLGVVRHVPQDLQKVRLQNVKGPTHPPSTPRTHSLSMSKWSRITGTRWAFFVHTRLGLRFPGLVRSRLGCAREVPIGTTKSMPGCGVKHIRPPAASCSQAVPCSGQT